ncbi:MAG: CCA tRNA nucleotidyltransferase [Caulobacteraceae bacterium]|nr:CCA tRNA nucleotidyltransferase [Caulobacteraceae bacterium]
MTRLPPVSWLTDPATVAVMDALEAAGGEGCARFVGGCVRNTLMGRAADDIDIATRLRPDAVVAALETAGLKAIPTGVEHGTVTGVAQRRPFEITTLRRDVSTDGRRATVAFTDDWVADAARRDFRLNAIYADRDGQVFDPTGGGVEDAEFGRIVFVGDAEQRIQEDYLRILRFFRFQAWYGREDAADGAALAACARLKHGIRQLSAERITKELLKLLAAPDPRPALRLARRAGVTDEVLLGEMNRRRWANLVALMDGQVDALLRLKAVTPDEPGALDHSLSRLRLSNAELDRLHAAADETWPVSLDMGAREARATLYRIGRQAFEDRVWLRWAEAPDRPEAARALLAIAGTWERPRFPLGGKEALAAGLSGPAVGKALAAVEDWWVAQDFPAGGLTEKLAEAAQEPGA